MIVTILIIAAALMIKAEMHYRRNGEPDLNTNLKDKYDELP